MGKWMRRDDTPWTFGISNEVFFTVFGFSKTHFSFIPLDYSTTRANAIFPTPKTRSLKLTMFMYLATNKLNYNTFCRENTRKRIIYARSAVSYMYMRRNKTFLKNIRRISRP